MRLQSYQLEDAFISANIATDDFEFNYLVPRHQFDHWLTEGTMMYDAGIGFEGSHVPNMITMDEYWEAAIQINDTTVKEELQLFLDKKREKEVRAAFHHAKLHDVISRECDPAVSIAIRKELIEYREAYRDFLLDMPKEKAA